MNLNMIPGMPRREDDLDDQLSDLVKVAKRLGLHKAMLWLEQQINDK